ncbi:MAG: EF-Tu/IF-2/RF-3 family GTPase [Gemmatimonadales bacterium]
MVEQLIGQVTHYFSKAKVAGLKITDGQLAVGDTIRIVGHTSDFTQKIESMQIEHAPIETAKAGDEVGIRVVEHAREHDKVYRVLPD